MSEITAPKIMFRPCLSGPLIPPAINVVVGVDVETIGLDAKVCEMGLDTGFIKLLGASEAIR